MAEIAEFNLFSEISQADHSGINIFCPLKIIIYILCNVYVEAGDDVPEPFSSFFFLQRS